MQQDNLDTGYFLFERCKEQSFKKWKRHFSLKVNHACIRYWLKCFYIFCYNLHCRSIVWAYKPLQWNTEWKHCLILTSKQKGNVKNIFPASKRQVVFWNQTLSNNVYKHIMLKLFIMAGIVMASIACARISDHAVTMSS